MNKVESWIKQHKVLTALIVIIVMPFLLIYKPYKATNPDNPLFSPTLFSLGDYNFQYDDLRHALQVLFPVGSKMGYVNLMLVKRGGAEMTDMLRYSKEKNWIKYRYQNLTLIPSPDSWMIDVYYDDNDKLKVIMLDRRIINGTWIPKEHEQ